MRGIAFGESLGTVRTLSKRSGPKGLAPAQGFTTPNAVKFRGARFKFKSEGSASNVRIVMAETATHTEGLAIRRIRYTSRRPMHENPRLGRAGQGVAEKARRQPFRPGHNDVRDTERDPAVIPDP